MRPASTRAFAGHARRLLFKMLAGLAALSGSSLAHAAEPWAGVALKPAAFSDIAGWARDDHAAAFQTFLKTCRSLANSEAAVRSARPPSELLVETCRDALAEAPLDEAAAKRFFEDRFQPFAVEAQGLVTAYFEPEVAGSLTPTPRYSAPLLARPSDLVALTDTTRPTGFDAKMTAAQWVPPSAGEGARLQPYPDRAAIEDGALAGKAQPLAYLDPVDLFMVHIQGSTRVRLPDGRVLRFAYDGRNGQPYTSVARILINEYGLKAADLSADKLYSWLRTSGDTGRAVMRRNRSYIFYRAAEELDPNDGPQGGSGVQLTPQRSLAVDRGLWSYGLPIFVEASLPTPAGGRRRFAQLMVAQDTGTAIVGPARGDLFMGSGEAAGLEAGLVKEQARFIVLLPRPQRSSRAP